MIKEDNCPLFIFEMANNHMGNVEHGIDIVKAFAKIVEKFPYRFAFKLQYRDFDTFVHPSMKNRTDLHYIKRFQDTRLSREEFELLIKEIKEHGFLTVITPFDENSVELITQQNIDYIKIPSCSFDDWPLLEKIATTDLPIIASTGGAALESIDSVVSFFQHRNKDISLLHCVGIYPSPDEFMNLSQIDFLKNRYRDIKIGFSTHENPANLDNIKIALAKGATIFEKHVGLETNKYSLNNYSATPDQVNLWLTAADHTMKVSGVAHERFTSDTEIKSLSALKRGVFASRDLHKGESISSRDYYLAFPASEGQATANDLSKYNSFQVTSSISKNEPLLTSKNIKIEYNRKQVAKITNNVKEFLKLSNIFVSGELILELSHHYGLENFYDTGATMITLINRSYCKKLIVLLPGQNHPEQYHKKKDETFHILYGEIELSLDSKKMKLQKGDIVTIEPGVKHLFNTSNGAVIEEISSTHFENDSFYTDDTINQNKNRKTLLSYWMD